MKNSSFLLLFGTLGVAFAGTPHFRNDYHYSSEAGGWIKNHSVSLTWSQAFLRCHLEGAVLASPINEGLSRELYDFVWSLRSNTGIYKIWTGISARYNIANKYYSSVEGVPLSMMTKELIITDLQNSADTRKCFMLSSSDKLGPTLCLEVMPFMCYKKFSQDLGAGECGTTDQAYTYEAETGSCYKYHKVARPWSDAYLTCEAEGGYLVIINGEKEATIVAERVLVDTIHVGYTIMEEYDWLVMTIHGETMEEAGYECEHSRSGTMCGGFLIFNNNKLEDVECGRYLPFVCEKDPKSLLSDNAVTTTTTPKTHRK